MLNKATTGLQQRIEQLQARAEKLRTIQAMIAEDPELATELLNILVTPSSEEPPPQPRVFPPVQRRTEAPQLDKVLEFFRDRAADDLATVRDICEATGLSRNSVNALLRTSKHKHHFYWLQAGPKQTLWRLRQEGDIGDGDEVDVPEEDQVIEDEDGDDE